MDKGDMKVDKNLMTYENNDFKIELNEDELKFLFDFFEKDISNNIPYPFFVKYCNEIFNREEVDNLIKFFELNSLITNINYRGRRMISFEIQKTKFIDWKNNLLKKSDGTGGLINKIETERVDQKLMKIFTTLGVIKSEYERRAIYKDKKLIRLNLMSCNIINLEDIDLSLFEDLTHLNLANNKISEIKTDTFRHLVKLEHLDLSFNKIKKLDKSIFENNVNIISINFESNHINHIDDRIFENLKNLKNIRLQNNALPNIDFLKYVNFKNLEILNLRGNILLRDEVSMEFRGDDIFREQFFDIE